MSLKEKKKILITGASGMLGKTLVNKLRKLPLQIIPTDIIPHPSFLDVSDSQSVQNIIKLNPDIIIHLAAYTDVDGCESNKQKAHKVNVLGTKNIALLCKKLNIPMLYISTDYVFDGTKPTPYNEWNEPNPINIYGQTKAQAEKWVQKILKKYWIVRTSGLYGKGGKNFVNSIITKANLECNYSVVATEHRLLITDYQLPITGPLKVVTDQIGSPTYTEDFANAIITLIFHHSFTHSLIHSSTPFNADYGIYHITNSDYCSWYEFAKTALEFAKIRCELVPITSEQINRPAKRPKNFRLSNFIWNSTIGKPLRPWHEALKEYISSTRL